jgi:predicted amidohydrolase YtcJ
MDSILHHAKIATNSVPSFVEAVAIKDGKISAAGTYDEILRLRRPETDVIDGKGRTVIPGLNDSHIHPIRGGLHYNLELRWDGVPSLADALRMLREQAQRTPPIRRMLELGVPVGAGTDATRVSSYNPFVALYWLITGKTVGGTALYAERNRLDRTEALRLYTVGSSWFSSEEGKKGAMVPGQFADLGVLSADYFSIPEEQIKHLESVLTIVGGKVVYAAEEFSTLASTPLPVSPDGSPVNAYGGYAHTGGVQAQRSAVSLQAPARPLRDRVHAHGTKAQRWVLGESGLWGLGCDCLAFA